MSASVAHAVMAARQDEMVAVVNESGRAARDLTVATITRLARIIDAVDRKIVALRAQASQTGGLLAAVGEERFRQGRSVEAVVSAGSVHSGTPRWGTWRAAA
jgi:hypothetical protein